MNETINKDYIGVIKENNGTYSFERINIKKSEALLNKLQAMAKNPNRTVLDLQECFEMHFKHNSKQAYDCCLPYSYSSSYIDYVCYPKMIKYDEYIASKQRIKDCLKQQCTNKEMMTAGIAQEERKYDQNLKTSFLTSAIRYIEAVDFTMTSSNILKQPDIRMMSHEKIGWKEVKYKISEDLTITAKTNFGYGSSSYFFINVCYKGINLLPYSQLVRYYYARITEIISHTRSYDTERESWQIALDFVVNIGNQTQQDILLFVQDWLRNEITEMLDGLKNIQREPQSVLEKIKNCGIEAQRLHSIRNMSENERKIYHAHPKQTVFFFKIEKLTSALLFINKLMEIQEIYEPASEAIQTIQNINKQIVPEIEDMMTTTRNKLDELQAQQNYVQEQLTEYTSDIQKHEEALEILYEQHPNTSQEKLQEAYRIQFPDYTLLNNKKTQLTEQLKALKHEWSQHQGCMDRLQQYLTRIADANLLSV